MRLLTYNIHKAIGGRDRRYRLDRIMGVLSEADPDLVCLQEVDQDVPRSSYHDQPSLLASHLRSAGWTYQLNVQLYRGGYGNLILARWPVVEQHSISLRLRRRKPRGAQLAIIESPEGRIRLINVHLGLAEGERHWQMVQLLSHDRFVATGDLPTVIAGDFNDWRNTLSAAALADEQFRLITSPPRKFRSFPAYLPLGSLDKVCCRGEIEVEHARVWHSRLARDASDHLPIIVDFRLGMPHPAPAAP